VWASQLSYEQATPIDLFARVERLAGKARAARPSSLTGELADETGAVVAAFDYRDDGKAPDARAGDGVFSARVALPKGVDEAPGATAYRVRARARLADGD